MTTIVIDCKGKVIASDMQTTSSCVSNGDEVEHTQHYKHDTVKCYVIPSDSGKNTYIAAAGDISAISDQLLCYKRNGHLDKYTDAAWSIAVVQRKGEFLHVDLHTSRKSGRKFDWWQLKYVDAYFVKTSSILSDCRVITFGSGGDYAYAGMMAGLSAEEAVKLAAKCDIYTNDIVDVVEVL